MKKIRFFTALALSLSLLATSLTGCTDNNSTSDTTANSADISAVDTIVAPNSVTEANADTSKYKHLLSNPNATPEALSLYNYIFDTYGSNIISGQQESTWKGSPDYEMNYIEENTGKLPAIRGLDYINEDFAGVNQRAIEWSEKGGIVSICWHWGIPPVGVGYESSKETINLAEALTEGSDLYNGMLKQMDEVAEYLKELQEAGVPVLWRPFHEFDGGWFWWGKGTGEQFQQLWQLMYDRYTNYHGLNNLIWVLGYSGNLNQGNWYPGDDYIDIGGADSYNGGTQAALYKRVSRLVTKDVPICLHENGEIPDPEQLVADEAGWVWFLTWHDHVVDPEFNTVESLQKVYSSDYVITLDELPDVNSYTNA